MSLALAKMSYCAVHHVCPLALRALWAVAALQYAYLLAWLLGVLPGNL